MRFSKTKMRLQTDQHILALERFDASSQIWHKESEMTCEYPTEMALVEWFKAHPHLKKTGLHLVLSDSLFQFHTLARQGNWPHAIASLQGLEAIKEALPTEIDQDQNLIDAMLHTETCEVALLAKASIDVYLAACKQARIQIKTVSPVSYPGFNLLNWRKRQARFEQIKRMLRLTLLPITVLIALMVWISQENAELNRLQLQNQTLNTQLETLSAQNASFQVSTAVQLLQQLRVDKEVHFLTINSQGNVALSGSAISGRSASALLKRLSNLPEFQADSMQDWETHDSQNGETWQVRFTLKEPVA